MEQKQTKLELTGLIAIVVGGVIGGGIFNISKILAEGAGLGAILISWIISGTGILGIAMTFKILNRARPDLSYGIYLYTLTGFGKYAGFNIAWSYWIGTVLGNVVFSIMLNDAFGLFFPVLLKHSWPTLIFASCFTWFFAWIVWRGIKVAALINTISTVVKLLSLGMILIIMFIYANYDLLHWDFWGKLSHLGSLSGQVDSTLLTTLFFFMGVEGAIIVSSRARLIEDVGRATIIGYLICLVLNVAVCVLAFGFFTQPEMVHLDDPALAQIIGQAVGEWGRVFVNVSVIIAVAGAWLVSTIIAAELPAAAARDHLLPVFLARINEKGVPVGALLAASLLIQGFLFLVIQEQNVYVFSVKLSGIMIVPTYVLSALFLIKSVLKRQEYITRGGSGFWAIGAGTVTVLYCFWVIYAGNTQLLLLSSCVYLIGILVYYYTSRQKQEEGSRVFSGQDYYIIALLGVACLFAFFWKWMENL